MPTLSADFLANIPIFHGTSEEERNQLLQVMTRRHVDAGHDVIATGETDRNLFVIVEGAAEVILDVKGFENPIIEGADAQVVDRTNIAKLEIGSVFGEVSFFHGGGHTATVRATRDLELLVLTSGSFQQLVERGNQAALKIGLNAAQMLANRLREADKLIADLILAQHDPLARSNWFKSHVELMLGSRDSGFESGHRLFK